MALRWPLLLLNYFYLQTILMILSPSADAIPFYLDSKCSNKAWFSPNTTYQTNLNNLLLTLSSNAASSTTGFDSMVVGNGTDNAVYGLFICSGDENTTSCRDCVSTAAGDLPQSYCPGRKDALIWYDECMVRYSNEMILRTMKDSPKLLLLNNLYVTGNQTGYTDFLRIELNKLIVEASNDYSRNKYAAKEVNYNGSHILYEWRQCTPDLTQSECLRCLKTAISQLTQFRVSAKILQPSCNAGYEVRPSKPTAAAKTHTWMEQVSTKVIFAAVSLVAAILATVPALWFLRRRIVGAKPQLVPVEDLPMPGGNGSIITMKSLEYDLATLQQATDNFSKANVLGIGKYGCVYKGKLPDGLEVAVKRLKTRYGQIEPQFKNMLLLHSKLRHKNLVKFLGFCFEESESLLVYEYVPNKSLDYHIYGPLPQRRLDWESRYKVIRGIARGVLYLHQESQHRMIHGDLKAESILLDAQMNPVISDFSMGNTVNINSNSASFAHHDVYKFGVLLFEIISGKKYNRFFFGIHGHDLLEYAWKKWNEGKPLEFIDSSIRDTCSSDQVLRCLHIGFLCVQQLLYITERPTMACVVLMLDNYTVNLPPPAEPAFFSSSETEPAIEVEPTVNKVTISDLEPR